MEKLERRILSPAKPIDCAQNFTRYLQQTNNTNKYLFCKKYVIRGILHRKIYFASFKPHISSRNAVGYRSERLKNRGTSTEYLGRGRWIPRGMERGTSRGCAIICLKVPAAPWHTRSVFLPKIANQSLFVGAGSLLSDEREAE